MGGAPKPRCCGADPILGCLGPWNAVGGFISQCRYICGVVGMVAMPVILATWENEAGGLQVPGHLGLHCETHLNKYTEVGL